MDLSRLKSILIILLVIINIVLLPSVLQRAGVLRALEQPIGANELAILARKGIDAEGLALPGSYGDMAALTAERSEVWQEQAARALLHEVRRDEQGGGVTRFESGAGYVVFRSGAVVDIHINGAADELTAEDAVSHLRARLIAAGFDLSHTETTAADGTIRLTQSYEQYPIINGLLVADISASDMHIAGRFVPPATLSRGGAGVRSPGALLIDFASSVQISEGERLRILAVNYGYMISDRPDGGSLLSPVLTADTDRGRYIIDAQTGAIIQNPD